MPDQMADLDSAGDMFSSNASSHQVYSGRYSNHTETGGGTSSYHVTLQVLDRYVTTVTCVLGCLGNIVNLFVLVKMRRRQLDGGRENGANIGLIALAISDLLFCLVLFPRGFTPSHKATFPYGFFLIYQAYGTWLITTFILTSTWTTVAMATLRYIAICHPLYSRRFDGVTFAKITYTVVFLCAVMFNLPNFWQYDTMEWKDGLYLIDIGHMDLSEPMGLAYQWIRATLGIFIPAIILVFCNVSLIYALRKSYRMRKECHVKDETLVTRNRVTAILVIIATSFIVLVFPSELIDFFHAWLQNESTNTAEYFIIRSITNFLQVVNFSLNFVLYCALNVHFRHVLKECICRLPTSRNNSNSGDPASDFERQWLQLTKSNSSTKTTFSHTRL